jgi:hypothetical protein
MTNNAENVHGTLQSAFEEVLRVSNNFDGLKTDTIFALGEAIGILAKAKALVGRDIDDAAIEARLKALEERNEAVPGGAGFGRVVSPTPRHPDEQQLPQDRDASGSAVEASDQVPLSASGRTATPRDDG